MMHVPQITPKILHLIAQLDEAKGQWQCARIESIRSSTRIDVIEKVAAIESYTPNDAAS